MVTTLKSFVNQKELVWLLRAILIIITIVMLWSRFIKILSHFKLIDYYITSEVKVNLLIFFSFFPL